MSRVDPLTIQEHARGSLAGRFWTSVPVVIFVTGALLVSLYGPAFFEGSSRSLVSESEQFFFQVNEAAGLPVLVLALWLFYRRSHRRDVLSGRGSIAGAVVLFCFTMMIFSWSWWTGSQDLQLLALIAWLMGSALCLGGLAALRAYWVPIAFLLFAIPISPVLIAYTVWPLQLWTAEVAGFLLNALGFDSLVQADRILRPAGTFIVIETCSGLRGVLTLLMLTILMIDLFDRRGVHALILLAIAPIVALAINLVRVVTLVLNPHSDVASVHNVQGISMLLLGLSLVYLIDLLLQWMLSSEAGEDRLEEVAESYVSSSSCSRHRFFQLWLPCSMLLAMWCGRVLIEPWHPSKMRSDQVDRTVVSALGDWYSEPRPIDYLFRGSSLYQSWSNRVLEVDGRQVQAFVGASDLSRRRFTILSPRLAWPASGWERVMSPSDRMSIDDTQGRHLLFQRGAQRIVSYSWYEGDQGLFTELVRHALALDRSSLARPAPILAVRLSVSLGPRMTDREARVLLARVRERLRPAIDQLRDPSLLAARGT